MPATHRTKRPLSLSLVLFFATVLAGLLLRFAHLGLPPWLVKYSASALWALAIYWIASAPAPAHRLPSAATAAAVVAIAVEIFKLYRSPAVDAFRRTLPGILLLGRIFSFWDIAVYCLAILAGALIDRALRRRLAPLPA